MKTMIVAFSLVLMCGFGIFQTSAVVLLPVPYMSQPDGLTCLPTSTMMALHYMGRLEPFSSDTVQMLHKRTQYNRFNEPAIARDYGLYALPNWHNLGWTTQTVVDQLNLGRPVILGLNSGRSGHFVLAVGYTDDGRIILNNPTPKKGSPYGGAAAPVEWKDLIWRGGVILSPTPFPEPPPISALVVDRHGNPLEDAVDLRMMSGDDAQVSFTVVNNGRVAWPQPLLLRAESPDTSPTQAIASPLAPTGGNGKWATADTVMKVPSNLPGTTTTLSFYVTAPAVEKPTTFLQYFNFVDGTGRWFSDSWLAGPDNRQIAVRMTVYPKVAQYPALPLIDSVKNGKSSLEWTTKHGGVLKPDTTTPPPPEGLEAMTLLTSGTTYDVAWVGDPNWSDYKTQTWIYCELRPGEKPGAYDRVGIFARDNGQHRGATKDEVEIGASIAITFDSDDGSIRAGDVVNGVIGDFRKERFHLKESGWHLFSLACNGSTVTYELDGKPFHVQERVHGVKHGDCGVYYETTFNFENQSPGAVSHGISFAGFKALKD